MPRKKKYGRIPMGDIYRILRNSTLELSQSPCAAERPDDASLDLTTTTRRIIGLTDQLERKSTNMLFFIMYDIESNKVRTQIAKYLLRNGCMRIQKSLFLADLPSEKMENMIADLTQVQACYENNDSIIVVPIPADYLQSMSSIGKKIDLNFIMKTRSTWFF